MSFFFRILGGLLCLCFFGGFARAEEDFARAWTTFRQEDGLAHNVVNAIKQAPDGALWFATFNGVSRYDGHRWQTFTSQNGLPSNIVWDLAADSDGVIWAGMGGRDIAETHQAVARYEDGTWRGLDTPEHLFGRFGVRRFFASSPREGCVLTDDGRLLLLKEDALQWVTDENGEVLRGVQSVLYTNDGRLLVAYGYGQRSLFRLGIGEGRFRRGTGGQGVGEIDVALAQCRILPEFAEVMREPVLCMAQEADGTIWLGTDGDGLWRYGQGVWTRLTTEDGLPSDRIHVIETKRTGTFWVGTPAGVAQLRANGDWAVYSERDGLPNNFVEDICLAKDGAVWVGTRGGVARFGSVGWVHHLNWPGQKDEGAAALVRDKTGVIWAGTSRAIYRYQEDRWVEAVDLEDKVRGRFIDFARDGKGDLWGGTSSHILKLDGDTWHLLAPDLDGRGMRAIAGAQAGGVWAASRTGVFRFDGEQHEAIDSVRVALALYETRDGVLWIGGLDGVMKIDAGQMQVFTVADGVPEGPVNNIATDGLERIWVSTPFGGVAVYNGQEWVRVPRRADTHFNGVRRIYLADDQTIWMASSIDGAIHTDGDVWTRYTVREGLPSSQVWDVCQDDLGQLWFATAEGLACYVPDKDPPETYMVAANKQIAPHQSASFEFRGQDGWKLSPGWTLQFSWRLNGGDWSPFERATRVTFDDLRPGDYQFEVRAMDLAFNVDATPVSHAFLVLAPVWQRTWFIVLSGVVLALLAATTGSAWQRHKRWKLAQAQLIEDLESELQEAHDMQMGLLPRHPLKQSGYEVAGRCWPANHVGGDYYTYFFLDDSQTTLGFGAADVSGKAMTAAVRAMQLSGIFRYEFRQIKPPSEVLRNLHQELKMHLDAASFITCCLGTLDVATGQVQVGNAAHPFPYYYCAEKRELIPLELISVPLGMHLPPDVNTDPEETSVLLAPGDALILYSDGVVDMQTVTGDFYEEARLERLICDHIEMGTEALIDVVFEDLKSFKGDAPQADDVTLLVIKRNA